MGPNGEQVGVVRIEVAQRLAQEADLDLVEVAPNSKPPWSRSWTTGSSSTRPRRRPRKPAVTRRTRPQGSPVPTQIEPHDYETKRKRAEGFLKTGDKVKAMILFRGREQSRPEMGVRLLQRFAEDVAEFGTVESNPTIDGRNMVMVVAPHRNKSEAKAEQNAQRAAQKEASRPAPESAPAETPLSRAPDSRPPGHDERRHNAEAEDPFGRQEALQDHGQRQAHEAAANLRHNFEGKPTKRTRRLSQEQVLAPGDAKIAKKLLGL